LVLAFFVPEGTKSAISMAAYLVPSFGEVVRARSSTQLLGMRFLILWLAHLNDLSMVVPTISKMVLVYWLANRS
jgi:hypothetical protein